jgi:seryl-tRNA synthetase
MIDIRILRENPEAVKTAVRNKKADMSPEQIDELVRLDGERRELLGKVEDTRRARNELSDSLKKGKPTDEQIAQGKQLRAQLAEQEEQYAKLDTEYLRLLKLVPNLPLDARFAYLKGGLVRLQFALMQYGLDVLTDEDILRDIAREAQLKVPTKPFVPVLPPAVARTEVYEATGRLNKEEQTYRIEGEDLWLNASAEHTLAPMYMNEIIDEADLPIRLVGYTTAFRGEAGTYGKDMEGIFRLHQFDKLEMESFTTADAGLAEHLFMVAIQEYLTRTLGLPYQVLLKCTADIGKPNARGVDINTWLPGQDRYRETHTADYITDYQTRRMQTRVRRADGQVELAHTNDATAYSQRPLIAIIENYQQADGSVRVPDVLVKYMGRDRL